MTYCESIGLKVGDKIKVLREYNFCALDSEISLKIDDGTHSPYFDFKGHTIAFDLKKIVDGKSWERVMDNDWIEWNGGECPVEKGTLVEYKLRNGDISRFNSDLLDWTYSNRVSDIIAYRLHKPETVEATDLINNPPHYKQGDIECIDAIKAALTEEEFRGYCKGNAIKYSWRERYKGGDESLKKAIWYLDRLTK